MSAWDDPAARIRELEGEVARLRGVDFATVLKDHRALANSPGDVVCACDRTWRPTADYRTHLADTLRTALEGR